ncbi:DUF1275 family protein [Prescottella equi]|uniref:DUF1275 family protein n=1 Tax=Rhodococcus hoagii TaxID=43767 RepID=UPI000AA1DC5D|nr:YoaK family protein [Prescottella equi]
MSPATTADLQDRRVMETGIAAFVGFVDALGFVVLGGFFVSSVDATTTQTGVALDGGIHWPLGLLAAILGSFLIGVMAATYVGQCWPRRRVTGAFMVATAALVASGLIGQISDSRVMIGFTLALAMGAANTLVEPAGLLVDMARALSERLQSTRSRVWARHLLLWVAMTLGAAVGAVLGSHLGTSTAWIAAAIALLVAIRAAVTPNGTPS